MKNLKTLIALLLVSSATFAQSDSTKIDSTGYRKYLLDNTVQPYRSSVNVALGGYVEANSNYSSTDGVSDGYSHEFRRLNIFLNSKIGRYVNFFTEIEFEHGTEEIAIEAARLDLALYPQLNIRGGILTLPIGYYNVNHDSPIWNFVERPLAVDMLIPSTLSDVGFGILGEQRFNKHKVGYKLFAVNGLQDGITANGEGKSFVPAGKTPSVFEEDNNGEPMLSARVFYNWNRSFHVGLSYLGGAYNTYRIEGEQVADRLLMHLYALDYSYIYKNKVELHGEFIQSAIDVPTGLNGFYGDVQSGMYNEIIYSVFQGRIGRFTNAAFQLGVRHNFIDFNNNLFTDVDGVEHVLGDKINSWAWSVAFRPNAKSVIRFNYTDQSEVDLINNPAAKTGSFQVGLASYF